MSQHALVTGADGFIGSHLAEHLLHAGYHVRAMVQYNAFGTAGWLDSLPPHARAHLELYPTDIRDPHATREAMRGTDVVFHLAALIAIPYSYHTPDSYVDVNITGTLNVLQAARQLGTGRVLIASTSEVYGTAQYVPIDEAHPRQAQSPYSASKIAADAMAQAFFRSFGTPITIVRPFNTYGPRQSARAVIPTIITQLLAGHGQILLGDTRPTRDLVHVHDTARAFHALACRPEAIGEEVNVASGTETSIAALAQMLIDQINPQAVLAEDPQRLRPAASEVFRLLGSHAKLTRLTGWEPTWTLAKGLENTIAWFREPQHLRHYQPQVYAL